MLPPPGRGFKRAGASFVVRLGTVTSPLDAWLIVPLVVFAAYLVFGVTGFGASPITIPVRCSISAPRWRSASGRAGRPTPASS
jgi:hypothetical protein